MTQIPNRLALVSNGTTGEKYLIKHILTDYYKYRDLKIK